MERRTNDSPLRNGQLDEALAVFRAEPVDERNGNILFQFETGGFSISLKRGMTMTQLADKLAAAAERVKRYQREGWPMIRANGH